VLCKLEELLEKDEPPSICDGEEDTEDPLGGIFNRDVRGVARLYSGISAWGREHPVVFYPFHNEFSGRGRLVSLVLELANPMA
jgi:hypothetical protein